VNKIFIKNSSSIGLSTLFIFFFTSDISIIFFNLSEIGQKRLIVFLITNFIFIFSYIFNVPNKLFILNLCISFFLIQYKFFNLVNFQEVTLTSFYNDFFKVEIIPFFLVPVSLFFLLANEESLLINSVNHLYTWFKSNILKFYLYVFIFFIPIIFKIFNSQYLIGYWLTNYNHGFVRRGLIGTLFINLPFSPNIIIFSVNTFVFIIHASVIFLTWKLILKQDDLISLFLITTPFFLLYPFWDEGMIGRPELLGIFTILALANFNFESKKNFKFIGILICFNIAIYTHEVNLFFLIPLIMILKLKKSQSYLLIGLLILSSLVFLGMYQNYSDSENIISEKICNDILELNIRENICDGAIKFLQYDETIENFYLKNFSFNIFERDHFSYFSYFIPFLFGVISFFWLINENIMKIFLFIVLFNFLPLFYLGKDWGRWISLIFIVNVLLFSFISNTNTIKGKFIIFFLIFLNTFYMNPSCCDVNVLVFDNVPYNIFGNNLSLFVIALLAIFIEKNNYRKLYF